MERLNPFARPVRPTDADQPNRSTATPFPGAVSTGGPNGSAALAPASGAPAPSAPAAPASIPTAPVSAEPASTAPAPPANAGPGAMSTPASSGNGGAPTPPPAAPAPAGEAPTPAPEQTAAAPAPAAPEPVPAPEPVADASESDPAYPTEGRPGPDDPRLHEAIRELRSAIGVIGVMIATSDGLALAYDLPNDDSLRIAAMAATGLGLGRRLVDSFGHESFQEQVTRGSDGYFVVYSAGRDAVLAVIAPATCNLGMLHHQSRRIAARLGELLAGPVG